MESQNKRPHRPLKAGQARKLLMNKIWANAQQGRIEKEKVKKYVIGEF